MSRDKIRHTVFKLFHSKFIPKIGLKDHLTASTSIKQSLRALGDHGKCSEQTYLFVVSTRIRSCVKLQIPLILANFTFVAMATGLGTYFIRAFYKHALYSFIFYSLSTICFNNWFCVTKCEISTPMNNIL